MLHFHDIGRSDGQDNGTQGSSEEALLPPGAPFLFAFLLQSDVDGDANFFPRLDFGSTENNAERRTEEDLTNAHLTAGDHHRVKEQKGDACSLLPPPLISSSTQKFHSSSSVSLARNAISRYRGGGETLSLQFYHFHILLPLFVD